jgi:hypothetical protein
MHRPSLPEETHDGWYREYVYTHRGETWTVLDLSPAVQDLIGTNGTHVFAWVSAGSAGRAAVS